MIRIRRLGARAAGLALALVCLTASPAFAAYTPDATFGGDGAVTINQSSPESGIAVATRSSLTYVAFNSPTGRVYVARLLDNGTLDSSWSPGGPPDAPSGIASTPLFFFSSRSDLVVQSTGKVLVTGGNSTGSGLGVARLTSGGALDNTFSGDGKNILTPTNVGDASRLAVDGSGRIYVAGERSVINGPGDMTSDLAVARLKSNGAKDNAFSGDGIAFVNQSKVDSLADLAVDGQNRPVLMGSARSGVFALNGGKGLVARLRTNGALDTAFSSDGKATFSFIGNGTVDGLGGGVDGQNRVLFAVWSMGGSLGGVRLRSNGTLDTGYSGDGKAPLTTSANVSAYGASRVGSALVIHGTDFGTEGVWYARITSAGAPDTAFGTSGQVTFDPTAGTDTAWSVGAGPSGSIVTAGDASTSGGVMDVLVTRLDG